MAEVKTVIVSLKGDNYPTWKIQCRMGLIKDGYWAMVNGSETCPEEEGEARRKFMARRGRALALIGLTIDPSLLYLIGDEEDPKKVWDDLQGQFQRKTWANKLHLRRKLFGLKLKTEKV